LLRVQGVRVKTRAPQNLGRDRMVACAENRRRDLDRVWVPRLDPMAFALSNGLHPRPTRHRYRWGWIRARVESGRPTKSGCPSFRSYTCTAFDDGNAKREREIVAA